MDKVDMSIFSMKKLEKYPDYVYWFYFLGIRNGSVYYIIFDHDGNRVWEAVRAYSKLRKSIKQALENGKNDFPVVRYLSRRKFDWEVYSENLASDRIRVKPVKAMADFITAYEE